MDINHNYEDFKLIEHNSFTEVLLNHGANNFIDDEFLNILEKYVDIIEQNKNNHCVLFRSGIKDVFSRGLDVKHFKNRTGAEKVTFVERSKKILFRLENLSTFTICLIDGICIGAGLEFSLACDIRVSSEHSQFACPEIVYGFIPGGGLIQRLVRLIGKGNAMLMLFSGRILTAAKSLDIGLIQEITNDSLENWGMQLSNRLKRFDRSCIASLKKTVNFGQEHTFSESIENDFKIATDLLQKM